MPLTQWPTSVQERQLLACLPLMEESKARDISPDGPERKPRREIAQVDVPDKRERAECVSVLRLAGCRVISLGASVLYW